MGSSLVVLHASNAGLAGSTPGWGNKIPHAALHGQNLKETNKKS